MNHSFLICHCNQCSFLLLITWNIGRVIDLSAETHRQSYFASQETTKGLGSSIQTVQRGSALTSVSDNLSNTVVFVQYM